MRPTGSPDSGDRGRPVAITARTPITAADGRLAIEPVLVAVADDLELVIRKAASAPATRVLGVVDPTGVLVGVVTTQDLVAASVGRLAPGALLVDIYDVDGMRTFERFVEARTAGDLMQPPATLPVGATLAEAFRVMRDRGISGVYVVDGSGRPVAYVDGLELAAAVVGAG